MGFFSRQKHRFAAIAASFAILLGVMTGVHGQASNSPNQEGATTSLTKEEAAKGSGDLTTALGIAGLSVSYSGSGSFQYNESGKTVSGQVECTKWQGLESPRTATLTFKNTSGKKAVFGFRTVSSQIQGSASVWGETLSQGVYWNKKTTIEIDASVSISISATYKLNSNCSTKIEISDIQFTIVNEYTTNFVLPEYPGTFKIDNQAIERSQSLTRNSDNPYELEFLPSDGYSFAGWIIDGEFKTNDNPFKFFASKDGETITPRVVLSTAAFFSVGGMIFPELDEACDYAKAGTDKTIIVKKGGSVTKGNYNIPNNVNLYLPKDDSTGVSDFASSTPATIQSRTAPNCFRELIFEDKTQLTFSSGSKLVIASEMFIQSNQHTGQPNGPYGHLILKGTASLIFESGSTLYCWGFLSGEGEVKMKSGSSAYEMFQMSSWRGGTATVKMATGSATDNKVFPVTQYYIQNVEASLIFEAGSREYLTTGIVMSGDPQTMSFLFIGAKDDDKGMFVLESGTVLKRYDSDSDRLLLQVNGNGYFSYLQLKVTVTIGIIPITYTLKSSDYYLPITNNIDLVLESGVVKENEDLCFLPGSTFEIGESASLTIGNKKSIFLYDARDWADQNFHYGDGTVMYMSDARKDGKVFNRGSVPLKGASINLNGTLNVESNCGLYSTNGEKNTSAIYAVLGSNARIYSSKRTGIITYPSSMSTSTTTKQYVQNNDVGFIEIAATPAKLLNGDTTFASNAPGNTYVYDKVLDAWSASSSFTKKTGLFQTLNNDGSLKTVYLKEDVMQSSYSGLLYYSSKTFNAGDDQYYYIQNGVVARNKGWYTQNNKHYYIHENYAYKSVPWPLLPRRA